MAKIAIIIIFLILNKYIRIVQIMNGFFIELPHIEVIIDLVYLIIVILIYCREFHKIRSIFVILI